MKLTSAMAYGRTRLQLISVLDRHPSMDMMRRDEADGGSNYPAVH